MKNKLLYNSILLLFGVIIIAASCKKLDEAPKSFITPENFYTTQSQWKLLLQLL
jgi:hypothetical protein